MIVVVTQPVIRTVQSVPGTRATTMYEPEVCTLYVNAAPLPGIVCINDQPCGAPPINAAGAGQVEFGPPQYNS